MFLNRDKGDNMKADKNLFLMVGLLFGAWYLVKKKSPTTAMQGPDCNYDILDSQAQSNMPSVQNLLWQEANEEETQYGGLG